MSEKHMLDASTMEMGLNSAVISFNFGTQVVCLERVWLARCFVYLHILSQKGHIPNQGKKAIRVRHHGND